jgi:uncharacterized membrane protein HdeD (DUF308 family)
MMPERHDSLARTTTLSRLEVYMATEIGVVPRHWWALALRGIAAVVFGILALAMPGITLAVLVLLFGAFALVDGVLAIVSAVHSGGAHVWSLLLEGIVAILAGVAVFVWPALTALILLFIIAAWAILTGVFEIVTAVRLRKAIHHEWALIAGGALSVLFGLLMLARPGTGAVALVWLIGGYAIVLGITLLVLSWRVRELEEHRHTGSASLHQPLTP